jgi:hypothetical protein
MLLMKLSIRKSVAVLTLAVASVFMAGGQAHATEWCVKVNGPRNPLPPSPDPTIDPGNPWGPWCVPMPV